MKKMAALILAAGRGTRMKSDTPKVLHEILGRPIIDHVIDAVQKAGIKDIVVVAGYGRKEVAEAVRPAKVVVQKKLLGSGDAVRSARSVLSKYPGDVLIICGDTPLVKPETIRALVEKHKRSGASVTVLTALLDDAGSYGRIVRDRIRRIIKIAEKIDLSAGQENIREVNVGTYIFRIEDLFKALAKVKPNAKKKEIFLTDTIEVMHKENKVIQNVVLDGIEEMIGINSRVDLAMAVDILKKKTLKKLMESGVTIEDPSSTVIHSNVKIGRDSVIYSNTVIESDVEIGSHCLIGPFARIRGGARLADKVEVGNFVELVRTKVGVGTKIKHHTYLGDTVVGKNVNVGAGVITANFDGKNKNKTVIGDGSFIGIGARLVAPVKIGKRSLIGAGSVVPKNHNIPDGATVVGVPARILKK